MYFEPLKLNFTGKYSPHFLLGPVHIILFCSKLAGSITKTSIVINWCSVGEAADVDKIVEFPASYGLVHISLSSMGFVAIFHNRASCAYHIPSIWVFSRLFHVVTIQQQKKVDLVFVFCWHT